MADAFEGEEFALQRDEHGMRCGERVQGEQAESRRTVDQNVIASGVDVGRALAEGKIRPSESHQFDLGAGEIDSGGNDEELRHQGGPCCRRQTRFREQHMVGVRTSLRGRNAETGRGVALRVQIER